MRSENSGETTNRPGCELRSMTGHFEEWNTGGAIEACSINRVSNISGDLLTTAGTAADCVRAGAEGRFMPGRTPVTTAAAKAAITVTTITATRNADDVCDLMTCLAYSKWRTINQPEYICAKNYRILSRSSRDMLAKIDIIVWS